MVDPNKLLEERRNQFISKRRDIENYITTFFTEYAQIDPSLLANITPPEGKTAQEIFPSLYVEPFDEEKYNQEYDNWTEFFMKVKAVSDAINEKAAEVLMNAG